ncbi:MAG: putative DNA binding protein [Haloarculaceae archaeon]|jgi:predicted DNA binding protein
MENGVKIELEISSDNCPVVATSDEEGATVRSVERARTNGNGQVTEEIIFDEEVPDEEVPFEQVIGHDQYSVYQFERDRGGCACEQIEAEISRPISDIEVRDGHIVVTFHIDDLSQLKSAIETFRETFGEARVKRIVKPETDLAEDNVVINRRRLTDRQLEVLEKAREMGYFSHPREANAGDIADELDIAISTFSEHLAAAESKLIDDLVDH